MPPEVRLRILDALYDEAQRSQIRLDAEPAKPLMREIQDFPRGADGLFVQPDELTPQLAMQIEHNRERMANKWDYADPFTGNPKTFDPTGRYNCGGCNQADSATCLAVHEEHHPEIPLAIQREYGSCGKYESICLGDPELRASRLPASVANYGVRKGGSEDHVFGCHECPFASKTKWLDSKGRPLWCGLGASTVFPNACCTLNGAPVLGG